MNKNSHKKLVVFDINIDQKQLDEHDERYKDTKVVFDLMKKASDFQTVVLTTSGCFFDAVNLVIKKDIKSGYLVACGGSIIYNIKTREIVERHYLDPYDVKTLFHHGFTTGLNIIFLTLTHKYVFPSNYVLFEKIQKNAYSPYEIIRDHQQLTDILDNTQILDLSYASPFNSSSELVDSLKLYNVSRYYDNEQKNFRVKVNKTSRFIHFGSLKSTKFEAIQSIMNIEEIDSPNDVLYIAATCCNKECYIAFKNSLVASDVNLIIELGDNKKHRFINEEINNLDDKFGLESDSFWK